MKRIIICLVLGLLSVITQNAIFINFSFLKIRVDLVLIYIVMISMILRENELIFMVVIIGILKDAFFPYIFGINTLTFILISYIVYYIEKNIYKDLLVIPIAMVMISTTINYLIKLFLFKNIVAFNFDVQTVICEYFTEIVFNSILGLIIYNILKKIYAINSTKKEWKF